MKAVKTIAALIFLSALAVVLIQPVLGADDTPVKRKVATGGGKGSPETPPGDGGQGEDGGEGDEDVALTSRYPKRCLRRESFEPSGLVAARRGSITDVGFPADRPVARIGVSGDVAWSPSGRFLAERGGRVFDQSGNPQGALFFEPRSWQWSPVADCALAVTERGSLTFSIPDTRRKGIRLLNAPVDEFALSPNGRRLAAVIEGDGLWVADLRRGDVIQVAAKASAIEGWYSNRYVLFVRSKADGKLRFAGGRRGDRVVRKAFGGGAMVSCGSRVLVASPATKSNPPLLELKSRDGRVREVSMPAIGGYHGYSSASCSPDASFIAASTVVRGDKGPLVLLQADGTFVRELDGGATGNPQWSEEGLIYVKFGNGDRGRLWLIGSTAAAAVPTQYTVGAPNQYDWHVR